MKMALTSILICCAALTAGVLLGRQLKPERAPAASLTGDNPGAPHSTSTSTRLDELSLDEILRTEPESILEDLAKNPFLDLSPDEIVALARSLDLTKERSRRLLNAVASTELRGKLWEESIRANVDKIPLEDLVEIASQAVTKNAWVEYVPIMEAIETSGDPSQILSTKWAKGLLSEYLAFRAGRGASLKESLALIPPTGASSSFRRSVVEDWGSMGQAKFEDFEGALALSTEQGGGTEDLATVAGSVWKNSSAQEKEMMMKKLQSLPTIQRERVLATVGTSYVAPGDIEGIVSVLGGLGSIETQELVVGRWLTGSAPDARKKLLQAIQAAPDHTPFAKLSASLRETEGKR